jgi:hypothetical protein
MRAFENLRWLRLAVVLALTMFHVPISRAQGTAFTYQGQLMNNGQLANGNYDFTFPLFATNQGGSAVAPVVTNLNTSVSGGLFLATLDFGDVFNGSNYWLEIAVRPAGNGSFTTLAPRQIINPVPYALFSANASNAAAVPASGIVGTIPSANLPTNLTSSAGTVWQSPSSTTIQAQSNTGYVVTNSQQVTITLPAAPNIGDIVKISGVGTGGWVVAQNAGQTIAASFTPLVLPGDASGTWQSIASSSDGTKLAAVDNAGDGIWTSRNSGASWTQTTAPTVPNWYSIASSADGTRLAAVDNGGGNLDFEQFRRELGGNHRLDQFSLDLHCIIDKWNETGGCRLRRGGLDLNKFRHKLETSNCAERNRAIGHLILRLDMYRLLSGRHKIGRGNG